MLNFLSYEVCYEHARNVLIKRLSRKYGVSNETNKQILLSRIKPALVPDKTYFHCSLHAINSASW